VGRIRGRANDKFVDVALGHNFWVMSNVFFAFCSHFSIEEKTITDRLNSAWYKLGGESSLDKTK